MSRSRSGRTARETVIAARVAAASGTATLSVAQENESRQAVETVDGEALDLFDELAVYLEVTAAFAGGTSPTMDLYLQWALRPNADPTVDADWDDFYHFPQVVTGTTPKLYVGFEAWKAQAGASELLATGSHVAAIETLAADSQRPGHWGDKLRVREKMGGPVSTPCTYSLHLVGLARLQLR